MTKPTPRTKPIDLSKCKVGQRVKLRNGDIAQLATIEGHEAFPYCCVNIKNAQQVTYTKNGRFMQSAREYPLDIVAILPLPKKAGKPGKKKADNYILDNLRRLIADFEASRDVFTKEINRLKGLLKP